MIFVVFENNDWGAILKGHGDSPYQLTGLSDEGYKKRYQDNADQAHHFWFYVELGAKHFGKSIAWAANIAHETVIFKAPTEDKRLIKSLPVGRPWDFTDADISSAPPYISLGYGRSVPDLLLGRRGGVLGKWIRIQAIHYSDVGDWIRKDLGAGSSETRPRIQNPYEHPQYGPVA
jgi:hypothetical protein